MSEAANDYRRYRTLKMQLEDECFERILMEDEDVAV